MDLRIDPEFAEKIPPLSPEELEQLEANILAEGVVINPLIVWNGVIVDGHNRYRILQKHPEITFHVYEKEFSDRYEVIAWICKNQLGRRNLTPEQRKFLLGKQYEAEKAMKGHSAQRQARGEDGAFIRNCQNDSYGDNQTTAERIGRENGTSESFIYRAERFAQGVEAAEEVLPGIKQEILSGAIKVPEKAVSAIAKASPEERKDLVESLRRPRPSSRGHPVAEYAKEKPNDDDYDEADESTAEVYIPSKASIRKISEAMASSPDRPSHEMSAEFIIESLSSSMSASPMSRRSVSVMAAIMYLTASIPLQPEWRETAENR